MIYEIGKSELVINGNAISFSTDPEECSSVDSYGRLWPTKTILMHYMFFGRAYSEVLGGYKDVYGILSV